MAHHCHAEGCEVSVPPKMLMCLRHWRMVPKGLQREVWRTYRPGQEVDKSPSAEYLKAHLAAVAAVAEKEGRRPSTAAKPDHGEGMDAKRCPKCGGEVGRGFGLMGGGYGSYVYCVSDNECDWMFKQQEEEV